jgi:hypothetical protein
LSPDGQALWIAPDGSLPPNWVLALALGLALSWGIVEPALLAYAHERQHTAAQARYAADRSTHAQHAHAARLARAELLESRRRLRMVPE